MELNQGDDLLYVSSAADLVAYDEPTAQDHEDLPALLEVSKLIEARRQFFNSVQSLDLKDENFSIEQQLAINKKVLDHIQQIQSLIDATVLKIREKQNGRGF